MIWEPFILALVLGIIVSAGLYFAYLWPSVEPVEDEPAAADTHTEARPPHTAPETPSAAAPHDTASPAP